MLSGVLSAATATTTSFQRGHVSGWKSEDAMTRVHLVKRRYQGVRVMKLTVYGIKRESCWRIS